jgi:hypothetical protein
MSNPSTRAHFRRSVPDLLTDIPVTDLVKKTIPRAGKMCSHVSPSKVQLRDAAIKTLPLASDYSGISDLCGLSSLRERAGNDLLLGTHYGRNSVLDAIRALGGFVPYLKYKNEH